MAQFNPQFEKIGDILLFEEVISQDQLNSALDEQKTSKNKIGHILIKNGAISVPVESSLPVVDTKYLFPPILSPSAFS